MKDESKISKRQKLDKIADLRRMLDKCKILPKDRHLMRERLERQAVEK